MKTAFAVIALLLGFASPAMAACTFRTITLPDGKFMSCMTCCYGNNCNTTCN